MRGRSRGRGEMRARDRGGRNRQVPPHHRCPHTRASPDVCGRGAFLGCGAVRAGCPDLAPVPAARAGPVRCLRGAGALPRPAAAGARARRAGCGGGHARRGSQPRLRRDGIPRPRGRAAGRSALGRRSDAAAPAAPRVGPQRGAGPDRCARARRSGDRRPPPPPPAGRAPAGLRAARAAVTAVRVPGHCAACRGDLR